MTSTLQASYNEVALANSRLRQEVDRLRVRNVELEAMVQAARAEIERLRAREQTLINTAKINGAVCKQRGEQLADTAAFLDKLADRLQTWPVTVVHLSQLEPRCGPLAADCRAKARELRGET